MNIINLTPHDIHIVNDDGHVLRTFVAVKPPARCAVESVFDREEDGIELYRVEFGEVTDLPEPQPDTRYIVSMLVRQALPQRQDLWSPGVMVRDGSGKPIGCLNMAVN